VVLTKCDKLNLLPLEEMIAATALELAKHAAAHPEVLATSTRTGAGIPELRSALAMLAR
jgi:GTP-binding protein